MIFQVSQWDRPADFDGEEEEKKLLEKKEAKRAKQSGFAVSGKKWNQKNERKIKRTDFKNRISKKNYIQIVIENKRSRWKLSIFKYIFLKTGICYL